MHCSMYHFFFLMLHYEYYSFSDYISLKIVVVFDTNQCGT